MTSARKFGLPAEFDKLRGFEFSRAQPASPDESARTDKIFGVRSLADLADEIERRVEGTPTPSSPS
jgi:hypothetical protein